MIRFAADEDFNHDIVRALRRSLPEVDIATVQDNDLVRSSVRAVDPRCRFVTRAIAQRATPAAPYFTALVAAQ
ncbi:MAG TPA: hypothetical protein VJN18_03175 [Polyangiaceae bacterium]|nr:hypothetical protein [Polyangiaceae bacterium]